MDILEGLVIGVILMGVAWLMLRGNRKPPTARTNAAVLVALLSAHAVPAHGVDTSARPPAEGAGLAAASIHELKAPAEAGDPLLGAAAPAAPPASTSSFAYGTWTWTQTLVKPGHDRHVLFGARAAAKVDLGVWGLRAFGMADASATQDGGAVEGSVNILDPTTFTSLEGTVGAYKPLSEWIAVTFVYGIALPVEGGKVRILERYPQHWGAGIRVGSFTGAWLYVQAGKYEAAGDGFQLFYSGLYPIKGRVAAVSSGAALGAGRFLRGGIAVYLDGTQK